MQQIHSAGIILFFAHDDAHRQYLLLHYQAGHWEFPKGKVEPGEGKEQAAQRELAEETGLTAELMPGFMYTFDYTLDYHGHSAHKTVDLYIGRTGRQQVLLSSEHKGYAWLPYERAMKQLTYENARRALEKAEYYLKSKK